MRTVARRLLWIASIGVVAAPLVAVTPVAAAPVTVVVTLTDPLLSVDLAHRADAIADAHHALLADLGGRAPTDVHSLTATNVMIASVTPAQRQRLSVDPRVASVAVDAPMPRPAAAAPTAPETLPPLPTPPGACTGTQDAPQLEPEALQTLNVRSDDPTSPTAASLGYDGAGVTVGIVTTNLDPLAPDFIRPDGTPAVVDYRTYVADGTAQNAEGEEAFGDVSSVVAQGVVTYDLAADIAPDAVLLPDGHCWIRVVGVAPAADVVATDAYDGGTLTTAGTVMSIDHFIAAGVDVINESFDVKSVPDVGGRRAVDAANDAAIDAGITVVASTGDTGANRTVGNPATDPRVIGVGATVNGRVAAQVGGYGFTRFGSGAWRNGTTSIISAAGVTQGGSTLDVVAPGDSGWSACSADPRFGQCLAVGDTGRTSNLVNFAGTSQAAPFVAGVAALVVQAYRDGHGGADPTPAQVQQIIAGTADDLGLPADQQGSGQVNAYAAVLAARSLPAPGRGTPVVGAPAPVPAGTLLADSGPVTVVGTTAQQIRTTVVNPTEAALTVTPAVTEDRIDPALTTTHPVSFAVDAPVFSDGFFGTGTISTSVPVTVQDGLPWMRLRLNAVPAGVVPYTVVRVAVFTPDGTLAGFGSSATGFQLYLPRPEAGVWTVVPLASPGLEFIGDLTVERATRRTVTDAAPVVVPAGGQAPVTLSVPPLDTPGDAAATLRLGDELTIPVVRRRPVDLAAGSATVSGTLGPVNGERTPFQTDTWEFDVPAGHRSLSAGLRVADVTIDATATLVGPDGSARSVVSGDGTDGAALTQAVADPEPGRWRYTVTFWGVQYRAASPGAPFTVDLALDAVRPTADGLPDGTRTAGTSVPVRLTVTNPGPAPLSLSLDARTGDTATVTLPDATTTGTADLPWRGAPLPVFEVPPFSTALTVTGAATTSTVLGVISPTGDTEVVSAPGTDPVVTVAGDLVPGPWATELAVPGPVGADPAPDGSVTMTATVETAAYDITVTDPAGVPFMTADGPAPDAAPLVVGPGATVTVDVVMPVTAAPGTRVEGRLALVTAPATTGGNGGLASGQASGDVVAVFPYAYTVVDPEPAPSTAPAPTTVGPTTAVPTTAVPTTVPVTATPSRPADDTLAATGTAAGDTARWGLALIVLGLGFVVAARLRRRSP